MKKFAILSFLLPLFSFQGTNTNTDLFFGDSITFGNELYQLQYTDRWSKQYTTAVNTIEGNYAESGASMIPGLVGGCPSFNITGVPSYSPGYEHIFVSYWVNDYLYGATSSAFATATGSAVDGIIAKGWPANKIVLCFNYLPESPGTWVNMTHAKALEWLGALRSVQQAKGTSFLDFYSLIYNRADKATYTEDLVHPSAAWNAIMKDLALTNIETPSVTLPSSLISFSGQSQGNNNILKWTAVEEQNVLHYEVEKSEGGTAWSKIGVVSRAGTSGSQRHYVFTDNNVSGAKQFYRLRTVDRNGAAKLSRIIIITGGMRVSVATITGLFPNPVKSTLNITLDAPEREDISVSIMDINGRVIKAQKEMAEAGTTTLEVNTGGISSGSYIIKIVGKNGKTASSRFIKN